MAKQASFPLSLIAATALLGGCSMIPKYERPAAPVATEYPSVSNWVAQSTVDSASNTFVVTPEGTAAVAAADIEWQTFFSDPKLKQLIQAALTNNRDLRVAVLNIEQARAQLQIRRADQFPTLGAAATGSRQTQPVAGSPGNTTIASVYTAGLALTSYELDFFGRVASLKEQALSQYLATEEGRKSAQISLISAVANAYLSLLADEELLAITQQTLATREESLKLNKLRFDNGVTSELDYRLAESLTEAARVTLAQTVRQRALDQNTLTLLLGQPLTGELAVALPAGKGLADTPVMIDVPAGLPSDLLTRRPDVRQAEQTLLAALLAMTKQGSAISVGTGEATSARLSAGFRSPRSRFQRPLPSSLYRLPIVPFGIAGAPVALSQSTVLNAASVSPAWSGRSAPVRNLAAVRPWPSGCSTRVTSIGRSVNCLT